MKQQRIHLIDSLRGLSLLGILLANLLIFQYGIWGKEELSLMSIDKGAFHFLKIFVEGSFMPIFTFLFGYSIIKMADGLRQKNVKVKRYFARRSILLMLLGFLHSTFIWEGDILLTYGMMGLALIVFVNRKTKTILVWGVLLFTLYTALMLIGSGISDPSTTEEEFTASPAYIAKTNEVYGTGTYTEIMHHRLNADPIKEMDEIFILVMMVIAPFAMAPLFLFGMYAARINLFANPEKEKKGYKVGAWILLPFGLLMKGFGELQTPNNWTDFLIGTGAPLLSFGYIFAFASLYAGCSKTILFLAMENVGKLSLTNYILQSIVCTTLFYGYGLGLFGKVGVLNSIFLGLFIFAIQSVCSHYYLKSFRRGPLETLLRIGTNFTWNGQVKARKTDTDVDTCPSIPNSKAL